MRAFWIIVTVAGLGVGGRAGALETPVSVQHAAQALLDALGANDLAAAEALAVDPAGFAALSKRAPSAGKLREQQRGFLQHLARELQLGVQVAGLELKDVLALPAGVKTRREVIMAVFHLSLKVPGRQQAAPVVTPLLFLLVDGAWKFYARD